MSEVSGDVPLQLQVFSQQIRIAWFVMMMMMMMMM